MSDAASIRKRLNANLLLNFTRVEFHSQGQHGMNWAIRFILSSVLHIMVHWKFLTLVNTTNNSCSCIANNKRYLCLAYGLQSKIFFQTNEKKENDFGFFPSGEMTSTKLSAYNNKDESNNYESTERKKYKTKKLRCSRKQMIPKWKMNERAKQTGNMKNELYLIFLSRIIWLSSKWCDSFHIDSNFRYWLNWNGIVRSYSLSRTQITSNLN